ncbi:MAG: septum site-determining protein MinC [Hahellaceae bacterium]|nr:septum site-determining protein MinC [Hahellaceae bacterium]MCP5169980.1 septum site-determining protein MinC [Hahellaceae bacterium]
MTQSTASAQKQEHGLQLRGALVPMTLLEISFFEPELFRQELAARIAQAPGFFENIPVIISLERYQSEDIPDFDHLTTLCLELGIYPVAIRGGNAELQAAALAEGLACVPAGKEKAPRPITQPDGAASTSGIETATTSHADAVAEQPVTSAPDSSNEVLAPNASVASPSEDTPAEPVYIAQNTRVITTPVRSGQQIYAAGGDLIVMAPVSAGAEILADGNIHVYGPLRGRALAGVKGNSGARIFCQSLEAELVSIAGQYKISEDLQGDRWRKNAQICLREDRLEIRPLVD